MRFLLCVFVLLLAASYAATAQEFVGTWKAEVPMEDGKVIPVKVTVHDNGVYEMDWAMDGNIEVRGGFDVRGDQVIIWETYGENTCPRDKKGIYRWKVDNDRLTMNRLEEACEGRGGPDGVMVYQRM